MRRAWGAPLRMRRWGPRSPDPGPPRCRPNTAIVAVGTNRARGVRALMDEDARRILDLIAQSGRPPYETMTADEARRVSREGRKVVQPEPAAVAAIRDLRAPTPQGDIALRLYRGAGTDPGARLPALIYFHGGGWVL